MNSQNLVVDMVRNWHKHPDNDGFVTKELELFNITLVSYPEEYPGTAEFKVIVLWDHYQETPNVDHTLSDLQRVIYETIQRFAIGVNCKVNEVKHTGLTTYAKLKSSTPKNVENFEWLELNPEEYKNVEC